MTVERTCLRGPEGPGLIVSGATTDQADTQSENRD